MIVQVTYSISRLAHEVWINQRTKWTDLIHILPVHGMSYLLNWTDCLEDLRNRILILSKTARRTALGSHRSHQVTRLTSFPNYKLCLNVSIPQTINLLQKGRVDFVLLELFQKPPLLFLRPPLSLSRWTPLTIPINTAQNWKAIVALFTTVCPLLDPP